MFSGAVMKKLAIAITAIALIGTPAFAADMAIKSPPPSAPVFSWTGFYVGGNVGYGWGASSNAWNVYASNSGPVVPPVSTSCPPVGFALCATGNDSNKLTGVLGGPQAGYNWQVGNFLGGIETDIQASAQIGNNLFNFQSLPVGVGGFVGQIFTAHTEKLLWLSTLRGRAGFVFDRWLFYATGGLAYGGVEMAGSATVNNPMATGVVPFANWDNSVTRFGWTVGGGVEGAIAGNWSVKVEYLHVDLGAISTTFPTIAACIGIPMGCLPANAGTGTIASRIADDIVRVGLNYQFH